MNNLAFILFNSLKELEDKMRLFGIKIIDFADFFEILVRFSFNTLMLVIIVRYLYYTSTKRKDYLFTYFMFGTIVFFLCILMANVKLQLGFAFGLFAMFSLLRYRTDPIPIKEMTYLFIVIGISVMNSLSSKKVSYFELILTNAAIVGITYGLEKVWLKRHESTMRVIYEKIELIKPENHELLLKDLRERTGLDIHRYRITRINFLRDIARIDVFYYENKESFRAVEQRDFGDDDI